MVKIEMEIDSVRVSMMNYQHVIILKEKNANRYLPIWIGPYDADAISIKLQNVHLARPMAHDFICSIISTLGGTVKEAIIDKLEGDTFHAKMIVIINKKEKMIDCRPSDALATAIRLGVPIFASDKVTNRAGKLFDPKTHKPIEEPSVEKSVYKEKPEIEPSRFELFSYAAQNVLNSSEKEAKRLNHNFIGTGHLLLALMKEDNMATEVLKDLGVNLDNIQAEIETSFGRQSNSEVEEAGLTTAVNRTIILSVEEAKQLGSDKIKPEHILIGLLRQDEGLAANLLKKLGITTERIYGELIRLYSGTRNLESTWRS
jgi:bifunctional DNase/RNase